MAILKSHSRCVVHVAGESRVAGWWLGNGSDVCYHEAAGFLMNPTLCTLNDLNY